ncbi:hypothetical protein BD410DRAFT_828378 [Rickenella mellea]|uniref:Spindle pole body component n=1 Tax=Rickenella mellea TaxID=50990 RepID=A0A4Y7Q5N1_9AGAM|nr:hypothetical protein BD410DRAFT_828378 [Rickenella mellea]
MATNFRALPPLAHSSDLNYNSLPPFKPKFFVKRLEDRPQNPIIETLGLNRELSSSKQPKPNNTKTTKTLPNELLVLSERIVQRGVDDDVWSQACHQDRNESHIYSWDSLGSVTSPTIPKSPFLTEQPAYICAAARYHTRPRIYDAQEVLKHLDAEHLLKNLKSTLVGCSSSLHSWDAQVERFVLAGTGKGNPIVILDGMDEVVSESFIARFTNIGTLLRRLESLVLTLRRSSPRSDPTVHAFAHALSCVLVYIRNQLSSLSQSFEARAQTRLSKWWLSFAEYEDYLVALAALCQRDILSIPSLYGEIPHSAPKLLSLIYDHLYMSVEQRARNSLRAILAYILTVTSGPHFRHLGEMVGLGGGGDFLRHDAGFTKRRDSDGLDFDDDDPEGDDVSAYDDGEGNTTTNIVPAFFPPELTDSFARARKSIRILRDAGPQDSLLVEPIRPTKLGWIWTKDDVERVAEGTEPQAPTVVESTADVPVDSEPLDPEAAPNVERTYRTELSRFQVYDLEPGSHLRGHGTLQEATTKTDSVSKFLDSFPEDLPSITPTLPHLTSLVLSPLLEQALSLSKATLQIFTTPSTTLNFRSHLILLRSYLLLTSHAFKLRLSTALFADSDEHAVRPDDVVAREGAVGAARSREPSATSTQSSSAPWAVGLGYGLTERETWPPGGSDLSFYLRTVIVDSLGDVRQSEEDRYADDGVPIGSEELWGDAEWRLGFAIRDLPVGSGRAKWLDPTSIERVVINTLFEYAIALDFLYMEYKPPRPLRCLITPDVLSKYQRVFTFLLRLVRVEHVMRLLFRLTRKAKEPVFQTLTASNKLLLHFRSIGQSFVTYLSSHVYDTAIGGNIDAFLARLSAAERSPDHSAAHMFSDVFSLAEHHSKVMDDVLSACLLRSSQRTTGDMLRACLETMLEFGVLIGELETKRIEEYEAAPRLEDMFDKFRKQMVVLVKALKKLADKESGASHLSGGMGSVHNHERLPRAPGGTEALHHLLIRIDYSDWWRNIGERREPID